MIKVAWLGALMASFEAEWSVAPTAEEWEWQFFDEKDCQLVDWMG